MSQGVGQWVNLLRIACAPMGSNPEESFIREIRTYVRHV